MSIDPADAPRLLPDRPNLRHLKAQARDLLEPGAAASVTDAQFQVARLYGFASWPKLKAHVESAGQTGAPIERLTPDSLIAAITAFLADQDLLTLNEIRAALGRELDAAGPGALAQLHERLMTGTEWDFYPADPVAKRVHRVLADKLLEPASTLEGMEHVGALD